VSNEHPAPDAIMQLTRAYAGSKALVSAVELELFTTLADGPFTGEALRAKLGLQSRGATDRLDALVSVGMLDRDGDLYANTAATDLYLDRAKPTYVGGMVVAMAADTSHWDSLTAALRTGRPQIEGDQAIGGAACPARFPRPAPLKRARRTPTAQAGQAPATGPGRPCTRRPRPTAGCSLVRCVNSTAAAPEVAR
jgi:hypothetical protein